jgi:hypothetical protein
MVRVIVLYGLVAGAVVFVGIVGSIVVSHGAPPHSTAWMGYLVMLAAMSAIVVGVRDYRDRTLGGVIKFHIGFLIGLAIAAVASAAYSAVWEIYLAATHYSFMDRYAGEILAGKRAAGVTGAAYARAVAEVEAMRRHYANPVYRVAITFMEVFPIGFVVALASAALLRNPKFLPSRAAVDAGAST